MNVPYKLFYRIGFKPWEDAEQMPKFVGSLEALVQREEGGGESPFGTALDLGTGSGIWGLLLARRGWDVTGIDFSASALQRAADRISQNGTRMRLIEGDVTALRESGVGGGYRLLLDTGTFHSLGRTERLAMGAEIDAVAAADATVILLSWNPRRRGPFPGGAAKADIEDAFPGWTVSNEGSTGYPPPPPLRAQEDWYRLRRA